MSTHTVGISVSQLLDPEFRQAYYSGTRFQTSGRFKQMKRCQCGALVTSGGWIFTTDGLTQTCGACSRAELRERLADYRRGKEFVKFLAAQAGLRLAEHLAGGYVSTDVFREAQS